VADNVCPSRVICKGARLCIEWAFDSQRRCPARDVFNGLPAKDQAALLARFKRLADFGSIRNTEHFKKTRDLFEFKKYQIRFWGDFRKGRFLIAHGVADKKTDKIDPEDLKRAQRILKENDEIESKGAPR
jgi:hypothetical protein